ncbi:MAG TPA: hypothetical protein VI819_04080 [Patescibacteria group bacterium]|nr:hypothetical protein [Patescibacteria group bacterium]
MDGLNRLLKKEILFIFYFLLFICGGFWFPVQWVGISGLALASLTLFIIYQKSKTIELPPAYFPLLIFMGILIVGQLTTFDFASSLRFLPMFLVGFIMMIVAYNLPVTGKKYFEKAIIVCGIIFLIVYIVNRFGKSPFIHSLSIPLYATRNFNHSHIGDFWAVILVIGFYYLVNSTKTNFYNLITPLSIPVLAASISRASFVAAGIGVGLITLRENLFNKHKLLIAGAAGLFLVMFLLASVNKSVISSRPYFLQAVKGILDNPVGVGLGNFYFISREVTFGSGGNLPFSFYTHNLILEMMISSGILSLPFVIWFSYVLFLSWRSYQLKKNVFALIFIVLSVNFMFDYTYFIPTMLWVWFSALGFALRNHGQ